LQRLARRRAGSLRAVRGLVALNRVASRRVGIGRLVRGVVPGCAGLVPGARRMMLPIRWIRTANRRRWRRMPTRRRWRRMPTNRGMEMG